MARGPFYSDAEKRALLKIYHDNEDMDYMQVADLAQSYALCVNRDLAALSQEISRLVSAEKAEKEAEQIEPEQMTLTDMEDDFDAETVVLKNELRELRERYENFMRIIFSTASRANSGHGIFINYREILRWLYENEPVRMSDKLEELYKGA